MTTNSTVNTEKIISVFILAVLVASCGLQQNLSFSYQLSLEMIKAEVEQIMGLPAKSDFSRNVEELNYFRAGINSEKFLALFF